MLIGKLYVPFLSVNSRHWWEINRTCCSPLMLFGDHVIMEWWMTGEQAQQWGKMSWTGNRRSTRLMMLAAIISRCEWSEINHLGLRLELQGVKNGNDQTDRNADELFFKKGGENNSAVHAQLCVRLNSENMLVRGAWDLCSLRSWLLFNNHTDDFWETLNNNKLYLSKCLNVPSR